MEESHNLRLSTPMGVDIDILASIVGIISLDLLEQFCLKERPNDSSSNAPLFPCTELVVFYMNIHTTIWSHYISKFYILFKEKIREDK